ncbi:MAG TPA: DUF4232 domain-containing protein [Candidatus Micrarchaeaceae archaeon]|nr:DUF4232 domain-containing protein [Candidatus Micrarchaeaceae archaeon]
MRLSSLLPGLLTVALMSACTTGQHAPTSAVASPTQTAAAVVAPSPVVNSPSPAAVASPRPLVIPTPTFPFFRCDTSALEMRLVFVGAGLGNVGGLIEVRNKSSRNCDLYGYAGVQLLDAHGRAVATPGTWSDSSYIFGANQPEKVIGLPAGTAQITGDRPVPGHAYIPISWGDAQAPCSTAAQFRVTPPDAFSPLVISAAPVVGVASLMRFCSGGLLIVNPTRTAFYR